MSTSYPVVDSTPSRVDLSVSSLPLPSTRNSQDDKRAAAMKALGEAARLYREGTVESLQAAILKYQEANLLFHQLGDKKYEVITLNNIGFISSSLGNKQKAFEYYRQALSLSRAVGDHRSEATALTNIGRVYDDLGEKQKALESFNQALPLSRAVGDRRGEATTLNNLGKVYGDLGEKQKALESFNQALPLFQAVGDRRGEATTLNNLGFVYDALGEKQKALEYYTQALPLLKAVAENREQANTLTYMGKVYDDLGEKQKALEYYTQALPLLKAVGDHRGEAATVFNIGKIYADLGEKQKALGYYSQALSLFKTVGDRGGEGTTLAYTANIFYDLGEKQKSLEYLNQALPSFKAVGDRGGEATTLAYIGRVYDDLGEKQKALEYFNQALPLKRAVGDRRGEASTLNNIGKVYDDLGEKQKALEYLNQALPLSRAVGDRSGEATALTNIGKVYDALGEKQKALGYYSQGLPLFKAVGDQRGEAHTLTNTGKVYAALGEKQKALEYYTQALPLLKSVGDRNGEAATLNNIGAAYDDLGEKQKALEYYTQALPLSKAVGDRAGEAATLQNIGTLYDDLGENQKALEYYTQALPLFKALGDRSSEAATLHNVGAVYYHLGERQKALEYYTQALPLRRAVGDRRGEATTLNNLGFVYDALGEKQEALEYYAQALRLIRTVEDPSGEAKTLNNLGFVYDALGEKQKALRYYAQALPIFKTAADRSSEALTLSNMMYIWHALAKTRLAIFFGKQSVNTLQQLRGNIRGLETETQRTYLKTVQETYRMLAELLLQDGRPREAQQALNLFKDQEFFDLAPRTSGAGLTQPSRLDLTPREWAVEQRYSQAVERVAAVGQQYRVLQRQLAGRQPTAAETQQLSNLDVELKTITDELLKQLQTEFREGPQPPQGRLENVSDTTELQAALRELTQQTGSRTVALYTLVGAKKYRTLLITPEKVLIASYSIEADQVNRRVLTLLRLLQSPTYDPWPQAQELYDIIFKPIEGELKKSGAQTLMWSLEGALRYIPMAALYDGKQYLVERYRNVVFTRANRDRMTGAVSFNWTGLGFGSSKGGSVEVNGKLIGFAPLESVELELGSVFGTQQKRGVISGQVFWNEAFTREAMLKALQQHRPLVHISSHFRFQPGDESASFLLLGDGKVMTLADMKKVPDMFSGVELLTLSACSTAAQQPGASGREIDGLGELAQRKGAKAVIASLWQVDDESTSHLMAAFYQERQSRSGMTKAEALQRAQLSLLRGESQIWATSTHRRQVSQKRESEVVDTSTFVGAVLFEPDEKRPFAHPHYWAPFILIGNWR